VRVDPQKPRERRAAPRAIGLLALLSLWLSAFASAQSAEIIVNPAQQNISLNRNLLRAIFTMQLRAWPNGPPIRVFVLPDNHPLSDRFYRENLGIYSYMLRAAWDRMVFTGTGLAPTVVQTEEEMRERVRSTPGAIGYIGTTGDAYSPRFPEPRAILTGMRQ